ncbi:MAG: glycoside hydrolase family 88 protein [Breznakibacter sp.]
MSKIFFCSAFALLALACVKPKLPVDVDGDFDFAVKQTRLMLQTLPDSNAFPRTTAKDGSLKVTRKNDWTEGFFPGTLWYLYEATGSDDMKSAAQAWTHSLEPLQHLTSHHDIGFIMYCSYGNGYRLTQDTSYRSILIQSARSLVTRFDSVVGCIKSWNQREAWNGNMWYYPVIIDNMMNLELLYFAGRETGDSIFSYVANRHAETTMKNQIREDYGSYHVVDYSKVDGSVLHRQTCQGYADNSTWARGQAWGIYGFTLAYRETKRPEFLKTAQRMADFFINHPRMPEDGVPLWDFDVNQDGFKADWDYKPADYPTIPRDASAAAITASALIELSSYVADGKKYFDFAEKQLNSLSSPAYRAELGTNNNFLLMHSVGSIPHGSEIDQPLVYADYYFLEALLRYRSHLKSEQSN